jgi:hypothetical protein
VDETITRHSLAIERLLESLNAVAEAEQFAQRTGVVRGKKETSPAGAGDSAGRLDRLRRELSRALRGRR